MSECHQRYALSGFNHFAQLLVLLGLPWASRVSGALRRASLIRPSGDEVPLHLLAAHQTKRLPGNGGICVFVKDVDLVHADLASRGANVIKEPQNYDYGMRDFDVVDLDGNHLTFGMESLSPS